MRRIASVGAGVLAGLWLGYYLGYHSGLKQERWAWMATEQTMTPPGATVAGDGRVLQTPKIAVARAYYYSNPHSGPRFFVGSVPTPVNRPDLRSTPVK